MQKIVNQFKAEEEVIMNNLKKSGLPETEVRLYIDIIKTTDPLRKGERNIFIKYIANILRSRACALQIWYIHDLLSKVTGLAPGYVSRIAYDPEPEKIIKARN